VALVSEVVLLTLERRPANGELVASAPIGFRRLTRQSKSKTAIDGLAISLLILPRVAIAVSLGCNSHYETPKCLRMSGATSRIAQ